MLAVVCHNFKKIAREHTVVELGTADKEMGEELESGTVTTDKPLNLSLTTVLCELKKPVCSMEFAKSALEWAYPKLLKQVGLMDPLGNVIILTKAKLRDSAFFHTAKNIQNFREIAEHGLNLSFPEIIELNRRFLVRFYHADGSCALLPAQYVAIGLSKRFPYKIKDLLHLAVPFERTEDDDDDDDYWKTLASLKKATVADPDKLHLINVIVQQHAEPKNEVEDSEEVENPEVDATIPLKPVCTPSHSDMDEETVSTETDFFETPIKEPEASPQLSNYERAREVAGYIYVIFMSVASTLSLAGDYFMGTGGHLPSPTRAVHDGPAKEAESISEIRPGRRSECRNFAEIIGAVTVFLFVFGYLAVVTYEATEGLAVPAIHH